MIIVGDTETPEPGPGPPDLTPSTPSAVGGPRLGCDTEDYRGQIVERCRAPDEPGTGVPVADLTEFDSLDWQRVLDKVSTASISLPAGCCDILDKTATWRHELVIFRREQPVWQGPITRITPCTRGATIGAWDMAGWLARRVVHNLLRYIDGVNENGEPAYPTRIAYDLAVDGFRGPLGFEDDPCGVAWTEVLFDNAYTISRRYRPYRQYTLAAINKLAESDINYTTVGKRLLIFPKDHSLGRTALLTCDAFQDDICAPEDGASAATRTYVRGDGDVFAVVGGVSDYYGLLEQLVEDTSIKHNPDARQAARARVLVNRPPIRFLDLPGTPLAADAPVTIDELVPGVTIPVVAECVCTGVATDTRLGDVTCRVDSGGEKVSVTLLTPRDLNTDITGMDEPI